MAIHRFEDAEHKDIPLLIGLSAASGGGKSHSAMRIALGFQLEMGDLSRPIVMIDTDNRRGLQLAPFPGEKANPEGEHPTYAFKYLDLQPPFDPIHFAEALEQSALLNPSAIIIDNGSDEWNGEGGILDMKEADEAAMRNPNPHSAWARPKANHRIFMSKLRQYRMEGAVPIIITLMAVDKTEQKSGKVIKIGWTPVCCQTPPLPRDLTFHFFVGHDGQPGTLATSREEYDHAKAGIGAHGLVQDGELATEEVGRRLCRWALGRR